MAKLSYFPLDAKEYILDEDIETLTAEEERSLIRLWCWAWINKYKRGHLLLDKKTAINDEILANKCKISPEKFLEIKNKLVKLKLLRIGKHKELFSRRQSKYKTKYELYEKESEKNGNLSEKYRKENGKEGRSIGKISDENRIGREGKGRELEKNKDTKGEQGSPKLLTSVEKINFQVRGGDPKNIAEVLGLGVKLNLSQPMDEKKIVQELVLLWNKIFPGSQIGNGDGKWGVFFNILRREKGYEPGIDQERIRRAIFQTFKDSIKKPLDDPFTRMCDRVNNRHKYED